MARILLVENDTRTIKQMKEALDITGGEQDAELSLGSDKIHQLTQITQLEEGTNTLAAARYDVVIANTAIVTSSFSAWITNVRKNCPIPENQAIKVIILGHDENIRTVRSYLPLKISDYVVKPIDPPLFKQKIDIICSKSGSVERQLYSMRTDLPVSIGYEFPIQEISEYGVKIKASHLFQVDDFVSFYGAMFSEQGTPSREVLGRCYKAEPNPNQKGEFINSFVFVGIGDEIQKLIRTWLRQEYIRQKQVNK